MNSVELVDNLDTGHLDAELLDPETGRVRLRPAACWKSIDPVLLRIWCHRRARYGIPTLEGVEWLRSLILADSAIEVGAGMGDLGFHLRIPMSDNYSQVDNPACAAYYAALKHPATRPPADVLRLDAVEHAWRSRPQVVVASWLTQKYKPGDVNGNVFGPDEEKLLERQLRRGGMYVHVGNEAVHGDKRVLSRKHEVHRLPFLVSRAKHPERDVVYVWGRP